MLIYGALFYHNRQEPRAILQSIIGMMSAYYYASIILSITGQWKY